MKQFGLITFTVMATMACSQARLIGSPPEIVEKIASVEARGYCPTEGFHPVEVFATNLSSRLKGEIHIPDFDRDGLTDEDELKPLTMNSFNIGPLTADSNGDGYSDFIVNLVGYDKTSQITLKPCLDPGQDTDYDLIGDCEERLLKTNPLNPDSDGDGIPDGYEIRFGANPTDPLDSSPDVDQDQLSALEEIKQNLPVKFTNSSRISHRGYRFKLNSYQIVNPTPTGDVTVDCFDLTIGNIPLMKVDNGNLVVLHVLEAKTVIGQGDAIRLATAVVLIPQDQIESHSRIVISDLKHQVVDGVTIPWIVEDGRED